MILVDTSVWVDHLKASHPRLTQLLNTGLVLAHPWVTGELSLGNLTNRREILGLLNNLPQAQLATPHEVAHLIDAHQLHGLGIGYVDAQLVAAALLTPHARLWTKDRRLADVAIRLDVHAPPAR